MKECYDKRLLQEASAEFLFQKFAGETKPKKGVEPRRQ